MYVFSRLQVKITGYSAKGGSKKQEFLLGNVRDAKHPNWTKLPGEENITERTPVAS